MRISLIALTLLFIGGFSTNSNALSARQLKSKTWKLYQYRVYDANYYPKYEQMKDMIAFKTDSTYIRIERGKSKPGKWIINKKEKTVILIPTKGDTITWNILKITGKKLYYTSSETKHIAKMKLYSEAYYKRVKARKKKKRDRKRKKKKRKAEKEKATKEKALKKKEVETKKPEEQ